MAEIAEFQRAQIDSTLGTQQRLRALTLLSRNKSDRGLARQTNVARTVISGQPEVDFCPGGRVLPVPTQDKALL